MIDLYTGNIVKVIWIDSVMERPWQSLETLEKKLPIYLPVITSVGFYVSHDKNCLMIAGSISESDLEPNEPHFASITGIPLNAIQGFFLDVYSEHSYLPDLLKSARG